MSFSSSYKHTNGWNIHHTDKHQLIRADRKSIAPQPCSAIKFCSIAKHAALICYSFNLSNQITAGGNESNLFSLLFAASQSSVTESGHTVNVSVCFLQEYIIGSPVPPPGPASSPPLDTSSSAPTGWTQCASPAATRRSATGPGGRDPYRRRRRPAAGRSFSSSCRCWCFSLWRRLRITSRLHCTLCFAFCFLFI